MTTRPFNAPKSDTRSTVVPLKVTAFAKRGIDWTRNPESERESELREAYLTYEASAGTNGALSVLILAWEARRAGFLPRDLEIAEEYVATHAAPTLRTRHDDALAFVEAQLAEDGRLWT
jgi:hypothetical protein